MTLYLHDTRLDRVEALYVHIIHETNYVTSHNIHNCTGNYMVNYNYNYAVLSVALYTGGIDQILPSKFYPPNFNYVSCMSVLQ